MTLFDLSDEDIAILYALEGEPRPPRFFRERNVYERMAKLCDRKLVWYNVGQGLFMNTFRAIKHLRARGHKKHLPHLDWKHDQTDLRPEATPELEAHNGSQKQPKRVVARRLSPPRVKRGGVGPNGLPV